MSGVRMKERVEEAGLHRVPVYQCPSHPKKDIPTGFVINSFDPVPQQGLIPPGGETAHTRLVQTRHSAEVGLFFDAATSFRGLTADRPPRNDPVYWLVFHDVWSVEHLPNGSMHRISDTRHNGSSSNVTFFDGHVEVVPKGGITVKMLDDGLPVHPNRIELPKP